MFAPLKSVAARLSWPEPWQQAWQKLSSRDQLAVKILSGVLGLALLYFAVWSPVSDRLVAAENQLNRAQQDWQWLSAQVPLLEKAQQSGAVSTSAMPLDTVSRLTAYVQQSLRRHQIASELQQIKPLATGRGGETIGVSVQFASVKAPHFLAWVSEMEQQGLRLKSLDVAPIKPGLVKATVSLEAG